MKQYNLYNLEASFKQFLISGNKFLSNISLKNYVSDLRHFFAWFYFKLKSNSKDIEKSKLSEIINNYFTKILLFQYKTYLIENNISVQSINRRLSTLRKLSKFFLSQGWIKTNPCKEISNVSLSQDQNNTKYYSNNVSEKFLANEYKKALESQKLNQANIDTQINDINEFVSIIS